MLGVTLPLPSSTSQGPSSDNQLLRLSSMLLPSSFPIFAVLVLSIDQSCCGLIDTFACLIGRFGRCSGTFLRVPPIFRFLMNDYERLVVAISSSLCSRRGVLLLLLLRHPAPQSMKMGVLPGSRSKQNQVEFRILPDNYNLNEGRNVQSTNELVGLFSHWYVELGNEVSSSLCNACLVGIGWGLCTA